MPTTSRIAICGQSLFVLTVEASLATLPDVEVIRFHPHLPSLLDRILALQPDIVVIENNQSRSDLALALLSMDLPLFVLNSEQMQGTLVTGQPFPISDLTKLISHRGNLS